MSSCRAAGHSGAGGDFGDSERDERAVRGVDGELHFGVEDLWQLLELTVTGQGQEGLDHLALLPFAAGRKPLPDRQVLCGILFVLHAGVQWEYLPKELGFGSGMTCWRRLRDWNEAGVRPQLHEALLAELNAAARLDWSRAVVDSSHVRAIRGGARRDRVRSIVAEPDRNTT